ncbi:TIGR03943 family protein [Vallitalea sediminicola]
MKTKLIKFNINICLKILLLLGFASFYLFTVFSGSVKQYVHPRIIPYIIFAAIVMVLIAILLVGELPKKQHLKTKSWTLLFFLIPLLMGFALPPETFDSSTKATGSLELSSSTIYATDKTSSKPVVEQDQTPVETNGAVDIIVRNEIDDSSDNSSNKTSSDSSSDSFNDIINIDEDVIVMDDSNYYKYLTEIYENLDKYKGTKIEVIGFVFKDNKEFADNEFVPARLLMVCCAADMVPIGFLCQYDNTVQLEKDSWVKVTGTLDSKEFEGNKIPNINATTVQQVDEPEDAYIYPY